MTAQISAYGRLVADPQTRTTNNGTSMAMARMAVSCLSIGRFDVFWLCIGTSGLISLGVNLLRWDESGISGLFVAHRLEVGQILPSGIRRFLQASNLHGACLHSGTIH